MKKNWIFGLSLAALLMVGCGTPDKSESSSVAKTSEPATSEVVSSEEASVTSESTPVTSESVPVTSESSKESSSEASSESSSSSEEPDSSEDEEEEEIVTESTVNKLIEIADKQDAGKYSADKYTVTCFVKEMIETRANGDSFLVVFTIADSVDSDKVIETKCAVEDEFTAQEFTTGAKIKTEGMVGRFVNGEVTTYSMYNHACELIKSALVDATELSIGNDVSLSVGQKSKLEAAWSPSNARKEAITWSSSDEKVATVNNGTITAIAEGNATITAKTTHFTKTIAVTVSAATTKTQTISFTKATEGGDIPTTTIATDKILDALVSDGLDLIESCDESKYVYYGGQSLKFNPNGFLTLTLKNQINVSEVKFEAMRYQTKNAKIGFETTNFTGELTTSGPTSATEYEDIVYDLGGVDVKTFKFSSTDKVFIKSITFSYNG